MIVRDPASFLEALADMPPAGQVALPNAVFMVLPEAFRVAEESAVDNPYMNLDGTADASKASRQAHGLASRLREAGIRVKLFDGDAAAPDGVFPNNVFATVPGRLIIGSMRHAGRRREAQRSDIRDWFLARGYEPIDLRQRDCIAELTGPMVIDRARGVGFCGMTERVDEGGLRAMHESMGLKLTFAFDLAPGEYHANVVMSILAGRACVLCPDAFADPMVPSAIAAAYPGRTCTIDVAEKNAFVANCIALTNRDLFMSQHAADSISDANRKNLKSWGFDIHSVPLDEIEKAGGSLRCMIAEVF